MIVLDTGALLAAMHAAEPLHEPCADALRRARPPRLLSPFILAELDYLVGRQFGRAGQDAVLAEVVAGAYQLVPFGAADVAAAREVIARYPDIDLGLADASLVVLADRHATLDLLTIDRQHFRAVRGASGRPFRFLPFDA